MSLTEIIFRLFAAPLLLAPDHRLQDLLSLLLSSPFFFFHAKRTVACMASGVWNRRGQEAIGMAS